LIKICKNEAVNGIKKREAEHNILKAEKEKARHLQNAV
jgi:hypothetical protein